VKILAMLAKKRIEEKIFFANGHFSRTRMKIFEARSGFAEIVVCYQKKCTKLFGLVVLSTVAV
jgi:hypothetical protein